MIEQLRRDGFVQVDSAAHVAANLAWKLRRSVTFTGHVIPQGDRIPRTFQNALEQHSGMVCHQMQDVLSSNGLFSFIAQYHTLAADYFQAEPLLYSVNAFWKKPNGAPGWHHDTDDGPNQLVCFMFGTDVSDEDGGIHAYVTGSHLWPREKMARWHNVEKEVSGDLPSDWPVHKFAGPAGTTFLTDTRGLHNGYPPTKEPRLLLWARWSTAAPASYRNDEIKPVAWKSIVAEKPNDEIQKRTRLVVNWS